MATSGTIQQAIRTGYRIQIAWTVDSQSVANNTSTVTARVQLVSTGSSYTIVSSASKSGSLTINGTKYNFTFSAALNGNQTKTLYTKTVTVAHAANGTKTCAFSATCGINVTLSGTYYGNITASGNGVFNTIARASSIASVTSSVSVNGTNTCAVSITRASSSFTHTVVFSFGSYSKTTTGVGTSTSYAIPTSWLNAIPNATSGTAKVTVTTYSGSTKIGASVSRNFTLTVPSSVVPTISSVTLSEGTAGLAAQFAAYVQAKSRLTVKTVAAGALSSTIKSYKTIVQGVTFTGATITSGIMMHSGTSNVTITVTDSRGRSASTTRSITVVPYAAPKIISFQGFRATANGTENYDGTYLNAAVNFSVSAVGNKNTKSYRLEYRLKNATTWTSLTSGSVYALNQSIISSSGFMNADNSYEIRLTVTDFFTTVTSIIDIPTAFTLLDFNASGRGVAFGKVSEKTNGMEIGLDVEFLGKLTGTIFDAILPVGSIVMRYDHTNPGTLYPGTTWARIYGAFPWLTDANGQIGTTGGERNVTLTVNQIPAHSHGSVYSQHAPGTKGQAWYTAAGSSLAYGAISTGGGAAHNNMPPYIQISAWRRTA